MKRAQLFIIIVTIFLLISCNHNKITKKAIWRPSKSVIKKIFMCRSNNRNYLNCVVNIMKKNGATKEAIYFSKKIGGRGFMSYFYPVGKIDLVKTLELGADYSQGCYIVNGLPKIINVLRSKKIPTELWLKSCKIKKVSIQNGITAYTFKYEVKFCKACKVHGNAEVNFLFNRRGELLSKVLID